MIVSIPEEQELSRMGLYSLEFRRMKANLMEVYIRESSRLGAKKLFPHTRQSRSRALSPGKGTVMLGRHEERFLC